MEEMIRYILDIDKLAREMTAKAEQMKRQAQAEIPRKKEELRLQFLQQAQDRIRIVEEKEKQFATEAVEQKEAAYNAAVSQLEEQFRQNRDSWVDQIVRRVLDS